MNLYSSVTSYSSSATFLNGPDDPCRLGTAYVIEPRKRAPRRSVEPLFKTFYSLSPARELVEWTKGGMESAAVVVEVGISHYGVIGVGSTAHDSNNSSSPPALGGRAAIFFNYFRR